MTRKATALYDAALRKVQELQPPFQPTQVIADFEEAPAAAIRNVFGSHVAVSGCWFHYAQALIKRLRKLGLKLTRTTDCVQMPAISATND